MKINAMKIIINGFTNIGVVSSHRQYVIIDIGSPYILYFINRYKENEPKSMKELAVPQ